MCESFFNYILPVIGTLAGAGLGAFIHWKISDDQRKRDILTQRPYFELKITPAPNDHIGAIPTEYAFHNRGNGTAFNFEIVSGNRIIKKNQYAIKYVDPINGSNIIAKDEGSGYDIRWEAEKGSDALFISADEIIKRISEAQGIIVQEGIDVRFQDSFDNKYIQRFRVLLKSVDHPVVIDIDSDAPKRVK